MPTIVAACATRPSCSPLRTCAGSSTSTTSGSCASQSQTVETGVSKLAELRGDDWEPDAFSRRQEPLASADVVGLHGYIIARLSDRYDPSLGNKFIQLDWGHDGFPVQTSQEEGQFERYFAHERKKRMLEEGEVSPETDLLLMASLARGAIALARGAPVTTAAGRAGTAILAGAFASAAYDTEADRAERYQATGSSACMRSLIQAVRQKKDMKYDLASWNCNHFADMIADTLKKCERVLRQNLSRGRAYFA